MTFEDYSGMKEKIMMWDVNPGIKTVKKNIIQTLNEWNDAVSQKKRSLIHSQVDLFVNAPKLILYDGKMRAPLNIIEEINKRSSTGLSYINDVVDFYREDELFGLLDVRAKALSVLEYSGIAHNYGKTKFGEFVSNDKELDRFLSYDSASDLLTKGWSQAVKKTFEPSRAEKIIFDYIVNDKNKR